MIRVLIVDDHGIIREGIKKLLTDVSGIAVVGEADSGEHAIRLAREEKPDVVLMDIKMPGIGGLETTRKILRYEPKTKVIAISAFDEEPFPSRLIQAGASGYITKGSGFDEVIKAIQLVAAGDTYLSPVIAQQLAVRSLSSKEDSPFDKLSERELQVMLMITAGQKVQEISEYLCLSPKTVNSYRYRIFEKLRIRSDVELTHLALRHGLIDKGSLPGDADNQVE
ncbi:MAG: UvrY/SirA/GacA family response regulator transcription factor [Pseudomonadota bacterium]